jgi:transcriptional regulator with XRE-family HTH domain
MKTKLTLQEKLRDLRDEQGLTLSMLAGKTGIPLSTLQRMEGREDMRVGYQDVAALAKFYGVSTDYLFGITDNRQFRHIEIDRLRLSDEAVEALTGDKLNNRLVSELLSHPDFSRLMKSVELYIDRKFLPQIGQINDLYRLAESTLKEQLNVEDNDENIVLLQDAIVDEDALLRFQVSERFNNVLKDLFAAHKRDALPDEQTKILQETMDLLSVYLNEPDKERGKVMVLAKQIGLDFSELDDEEIAEMKRVVRIAQNHAPQPDGRRR